MFPLTSIARGFKTQERRTTLAAPARTLKTDLLRGLLRRAKLAREYFCDYRRMVRYSSAVNRGDNREKLQALITMDYHGLEKGLSLPRPRPGFGEAKAAELLGTIETYVSMYGADNVVVTAMNVLRAYLESDAQAGLQADHLLERFLQLKHLIPPSSTVHEELTKGGCKKLTRLELLDASCAPFEQFAQLRYSVRQFSREKVDLQTIRSAVRVAQKTPSVCNRQPWRVWVVTGPDKIHVLLNIGGGARGFEEEIGVLLVVTSDLSCFQSPGERNQCWIDGGMFGMSLIYALHAKGLTSCCMNWSKTRKDDSRLRQFMMIPDSECIIFLLAVGHPRDEFLVATSTRRPLTDVIRYWENGRYDYDLFEIDTI